MTMLPLTRSMPMEDGEMMQILRLEWGTLASTLDTLKDMVSGCRDMSKGMHKFQIPVSFDNNVISDHVQCPGQRGPA